MSTTNPDWPVHKGPEEAPVETGIDFVGAVLSRKFLVLMLVGTGVALGYLYSTKQAPVFASFAKVMVIRPDQVIAGDEKSQQAMNNMADQLDNHLYLLTQPSILNDALNPKIKEEAAKRKETAGERQAERDRALASVETEYRNAQAEVAAASAEMDLVNSRPGNTIETTQLAADKHRKATQKLKRVKWRLDETIARNKQENDLEARLNEEADRIQDLRSLRTLIDSSNPLRVISSGLRVNRSEISNDALEISYSGSNSDDCPVILEGILQSYDRWLKKEQLSKQADWRDLLQTAQQTLQQKMQQSREEYLEWRDGAKLLFDGDKGVNYYESRLKKIEDERQAKTLEKNQLTVQLAAMQDALSRNASREALLLMANMLKTEPLDTSAATGGAIAKAPAIRIDPIMRELTPLMVERETLLERYGPEHTQIKMLNKKIDSLRAVMEEQAGAIAAAEAAAEAAAQASAEGNKPKEKPDLLALHMESMKERITTLNGELAALDGMFREETSKARELRDEMEKDRSFADQYEQQKKLFDGLVAKLLTLDANSMATGMRAQVTSRPSTAIQIGPNVPQALGMGGVGGLLAAIGLAFLLEAADKSFRNADEISKQLRLPVIGHIPELDSDRDWKMVKDAVIDSSLSVHHRPKSRLAESYRAVRAAVFFAMRKQKSCVLQVTSANAGDGKTTLSCNLAAAIAMSGKKTLLVDCDLRRPRVHKLFGANLDVGLSNVIRDGMDIPDATQTTLVPNLDVMTIGPRVDNPAELLLSPQFTDIVAQMREKYDFVIMDSPPILIVTDPAAVAAHVDGVILVVRNTKRSRPQTRRVRETLDLIGAQVLGAVVNGISERTAGYGYTDSYSYNYTTSYRSRSGGGYTDERVGHAYYDESRNRR